MNKIGTSLANNLHGRELTMIIKKIGFIEYGIIGWFLMFCLLITMAITSDIKAKPVYIGKSQIITGIDVEIGK